MCLFAGIHEICDYVTRGHYQLACAKHFELLHGQLPMNGINHPNHYFEQSQKILNEKFPQSQENGKNSKIFLNFKHFISIHKV